MSQFHSRPSHDDVLPLMLRESLRVPQTGRRRSGRVCSIFLAAILAGALASQTLAAPVCDRTIAIDEQCEIALDALHPTQSAVGLLQVEERVAKLRGRADVIEKAGKRAIPVVQAPDGSFYLTDGHHQASVMARLGVPRVAARVIGRFDDPATFWSEMQARPWVYLFDQYGQPITPAALPKRVVDLADDPYRALAGYAGDVGYFHKTDAYFMEFHWARYFGDRMKWQQINRENLPAALQRAAKLACQAEAKDLPGYGGACLDGQ